MPDARRQVQEIVLLYRSGFVAVLQLSASVEDDICLLFVRVGDCVARSPGCNAGLTKPNNSLQNTQRRVALTKSRLVLARAGSEIGRLGLDLGQEPVQERRIDASGVGTSHDTNRRSEQKYQGWELSHAFPSITPHCRPAN